VEQVTIRGRGGEYADEAVSRRKVLSYLRESRNRTPVILLTILVCIPIFGGRLWPKSPTAIDLSQALKSPVLFGGSWQHPLGTDELGRDELARIIAGAQVSMVVGLSVVVISFVVGVSLGILAAYRGGAVGWALDRIIDIGLAMPGLLLILVLLAVLGPSEKLVIVGLSLENWMVFARFSRALALRLKTSGYIEAAELIGVRQRVIITRHLLPNSLSPLLTLCTLEFAQVILKESALSYLGYGIQPPKVSWGLMVASGQDYLSVDWWLVFLPGLALILTVLTASRIGRWIGSSGEPSVLLERGGRAAKP
jgi:peptide/nickel transport system permease protein